MPNIYDNIQVPLSNGLRKVLPEAKSCSFCVGYFNLRGWGCVADQIERLRGCEGDCCRLLVGMHRSPDEEMRSLQSGTRRPSDLDGPTLARLKRHVTETFKEQLELWR